jgi:hypothetical protein
MSLSQSSTVCPLPINDHPVSVFRRTRLRNACLSFLLLPLSLAFSCLLGGQALASGLSVPTVPIQPSAVAGTVPIEPSAVAGTISGTPSQSSIAPTTAVPVSVEQHPSASATTKGASEVAPLVRTTASAATPVINTTAAVIKATAKTAGPAIKATTASTATQSVKETVAPAIAKAQRTVVTTTGPALAVTRTVAKESAPVLGTSVVAGKDATSRVSQATSTVSGIVRGVVHDTTTASGGDIKSTGSALIAHSAPLGFVVRGLPTRLTGAPASKPSGRQTQPTVGALPLPTSPQSESAETIKPIASSPAGANLTDPAGATSTLPACAGSAIRPAAEALIVSCASAGPLPMSSVSAAQLLEPQIGTEPYAASTFSRNRAGGHPAVGPIVGIPAAPNPAPLPQGSSGATASGVGVAFSIFLILAGLLLIGGLAAMRLLRLASEPWRVAQFVLVPERPG